MLLVTILSSYPDCHEGVSKPCVMYFHEQFQWHIFFRFCLWVYMCIYAVPNFSFFVVTFGNIFPHCSGFCVILWKAHLTKAESIKDKIWLHINETMFLDQNSTSMIENVGRVKRKNITHNPTSQWQLPLILQHYVLPVCPTYPCFSLWRVINT